MVIFFCQAQDFVLGQVYVRVGLGVARLYVAS